MLVDEKWKNAERPPDKRHAQALREAVEAGAVSWLMLQKKLNTSAQEGVELLKWLIAQGFVEGNGDLNLFQKTVMTEEEFAEYCEANKISTKKRSRAVTVQDALYEASLRLFIKKGVVNVYLLINTFAVGSAKARKVFDKLWSDGHIRFGEKGYELTRTKEEYEAWLKEKI